MRVVYDVSYLGSVVTDRRTGVARAIEHTAAALSQRRDIDLKLGAFESLLAHAWTVRYLRAHPILSAVDGPSSVMVNRVAEGVADLYDFPRGERGWPRYRKSAKNRISLAILRALEPVRRATDRISSTDIVHATTTPVHPDFVRARASFVTVFDMTPFVVRQFHHESAREYLRGVLRALGRDGFAICISEATRRDLLDWCPRVDPARVSVAHLAADDRFRPCTDLAALDRARRAYGIGEAPYFLCLNTLEPRKNMDAVVRCFAQLVTDQRLRDARLVLAGARGWMCEKLDETLRSFPDVRRQIVFAGFVADQDLPALYAGARAFVYPSHYEGFGLPPLEAMQCGAPVIASNNSSLPEIVGDAGVLVSSKDDDSICQAMLDLWNDDAKCADLRTRGLARAAAFTWTRTADATVAAYRRALPR